MHNRSQATLGFMLKTAQGTSGLLPVNFLASFAFSHEARCSQRLKQPLSIIFSIFTLSPATTSAKKLAVNCMLYSSDHSSHLLHPAHTHTPPPFWKRQRESFS